MILVTGATGTVGREVVRSLVDGGHPVRTMTRSPQAAGPAGAEAVRGDFDDPASLAAAHEGVRAVLLVTTDPLRPEQDARALEAARAAGVQQVVKLSALAVADPSAGDLVTRWQRRNEELLRGAGPAWTLLRPRAFMSNTLGWAGSLRTGSPVPVLGLHARTACVDPRDVAEAAVAALTDPAAHRGRVYALTGPEALSAQDQADRLERLLGRRPRLVAAGPEGLREALLRRHPAPVADALVESGLRQLAGAKAEVGPTVREVTGRPARSYAQWAADHAEAFGGPAPALRQPPVDAR